MKREKIYEGHQARALRLLSKVQEDMGLVAESKATMASALYLCDLVQDEQWNRKLRLLQTLDGSQSWVKSEMDRMFDELVFFYDRWKWPLSWGHGGGSTRSVDRGHASS